MDIHVKAVLGACLLACSTMVAHPALGQEPPVLDSLLAERLPPEPRGALRLGEALSLTRLHHPSLQSLAWRVRASQARRRDAGRLPNPALEAEVENIGGSLGQDYRETTIRAEQVIELGGKSGARAGFAEAQINLAFAELSEEERRELSTTAERFLDAWTLQERLVRLVRAERLAELTIEAADERHRAGAVPEVERVRAEAMHALRQSERQRASAELAVAVQRLVRQWGSSAARFDSLVLESPQAGPIPPADSLIALLDAHPERLRAAAENAVAEAQIREARAARVPDLALQAGARHLAEADGTGFLFGVSMPLPLWKRQGGAIEAAEADQSAARTRDRFVRLRLDDELRTAHTVYRAAVETYETLETRVRPKHEEALRQLASGYRAGRFSSLDLLDAQRSLLETEFALIEAKADSWRVRQTLERLIGAPLEQLQEEGR